ncbi:hypothetical protein MMC30_008213 [Trapelia coarctata]|nr:hypothetical protein [Trapelia coarctata]
MDRYGAQWLLDRNRLEPIAVVGLSFGFPQTATSSNAFGELLMQKGNTATEFPESRLSAAAMYHPDSNRRGQISVRKGHFVQDSLAAFDAPFFSISTSDAANMDPQQRGLLEYTYKALANAGLPLETVTGTKTSVYTGCFTNDRQHLCFKDSEECGTTTALGSQSCLNANRISWFYNFTGNSANIDTACSSSLACLDFGCKGLLNGDAEMSIVAGCNMIFSPDTMHSLTNLNMLSPDGQCYSFDHRGSGYGRGEGFGILVLKRLSDALRDNHTVRAIIRNTGCNQDGYTPGITQPNIIAQENLIRETYSTAGLSMEPTRYFEAHGTGTSIGDPVESTALGSAFRQSRTLQDPLWVGAVKSNIGHLGGASGLAGVIKTILVLEKAIIPPNANFELTNPKIDTDFLRIKFSLEPMPWPTKGLRRASVNSFENAGTNAHVILDDPFHYFQEHGIVGYHITVQNPPAHVCLEPIDLQIPPMRLNGSLDSLERQIVSSRILILSAQDKSGIERQATEYTSYFSKLKIVPEYSQTYLDDLAYTLALKRTSMNWKLFAVVSAMEDLRKLDKILCPAQKSIPEPALCWIFTGQGAQWAGMGRKLMKFPVFANSLNEAEEYLLELGCPWRLLEEMFKEKQHSSIHRPEFYQPMCTAIQVALVDLLDSFGAYATAVLGHSSGEIAAAYSVGAISAKSAWKIAYYRGTSAARLVKSQREHGAMISVGLSYSDVYPYLDKASAQFTSCALTVSCINSSKNVTISGDTSQVNALKSLLDQDQIFARILLVDVAYHSPHMEIVASDYRTMIQDIKKGDARPRPITMISSVTGKAVTGLEMISPEYWVSNMVSPVRFLDAVVHLFSQSAQRVRKRLVLSHRNHFHINMLVEIGPHSALQGPVRDILIGLQNSTSIGYTSVLVRKSSAMHSMMTAVGHMACLGYPINWEKVNFPNTQG